MVKVIGDAISGKEVRSLPQSLWRTEQIRALEQRWAEREGQELYALMERAGAALRTYATHHWPRSCRWWIFVGPGNNGGDGYVLARLARQIGLEPRVIAARAPDELKGDARRAADDWLALGDCADGRRQRAGFTAAAGPGDRCTAWHGCPYPPLAASDKDRRNNQ